MEQVSILDLVPRPVAIEVAPGKSITINALGLEDIVKLMWDHQDAIVAMYDEVAGAEEGKQPDLSRFLVSTPELCASVIAYGAGVPDQAEAVRKLPGTVQLIALTSIWTMSVPDPKKLVETLKVLAAELQRLRAFMAEEKASEGNELKSLEPTLPS